MEQPNNKQSNDSGFLIFTLLIFGLWVYVFNGKDTAGGVTALAALSTIGWIITGLVLYSGFRWLFGIIIALIILIKCWLPIALFLIWPPLFWIWIGAKIGDKD